MGLCAFVLALILALPASAQVYDTKAARKALFSEKGYMVEVPAALPPNEAATIKAIVPLIAQQLNQPVRYYGAIAWSPDDGIVHESLHGAMNYHSPEAAGKAAIAACEPFRTLGARPCEVAGLILPKKFEPAVLTMSAEATTGFAKTYRREKLPKSFAISRASGSWGVGATDEEAIHACNQNADLGDCYVAIRD